MYTVYLYLYKVPSVVKFTKTRNRRVVLRDLGGGGERRKVVVYGWRDSDL